MKRAEVLRQMIKDVPATVLIHIGEKILSADDVLAIYDSLNEEIQFGDAGTDPEQEPEKKTTRNRNIDKGKIKALWKAGWKAKDIAEECKCSVAVVYKIIS